MALKIINYQVLSYCEIPEGLTENHYLSESQPDCYILYKVTSRDQQKKFDFEIDDWIIETYPELEGKEIMIHIDY